jgi:hypothetical protein
MPVVRSGVLHVLALRTLLAASEPSLDDLRDKVKRAVTGGGLHADTGVSSTT